MCHSLVLTSMGNFKSILFTCLLVVIVGWSWWVHVCVLDGIKTIFRVDALHRPYGFWRPNSRSPALAASTFICRDISFAPDM